MATAAAMARIRERSRTASASSAATRSLTSGEITLAKKVFVNSIDYSKVKIHHEKAAFFQPSRSGMTPNGEIYIDGTTVRDYSVATIDHKSFFIHEMTHVWQKQNGVLNPILSALGNSIRHFFNYNNAYFYLLDSSEDLLDYRMEQQAQIIEDYVRIDLFGTNPIVRGGTAYIENTGLTPTDRKALYKDVLKNFLINPACSK